MTTEPKLPGKSGVRDDGGLTARIGRATGRLALRPVRAVAEAGRDAFTDEAERAIDGVMAGPLPEAVGRSLVEHRVVERLASEMLEAREAESTTSAPEIDLDHVERLARELIENTALERMLVETGPQPADDLYSPRRSRRARRSSVRSRTC